jgi:predicted nucleotidyltransferase
MGSPLENALKVIIDTISPDKVILFGSRAGNEDRPDSDYDLLVLKDGLKSCREATRNIYRNFRNIGAPIDVIVAGTESYEKHRADPYMIYNEAEKNGRVIYEKPPGR